MGFDSRLCGVMQSLDPAQPSSSGLVQTLLHLRSVGMTGEHTPECGHETAEFQSQFFFRCSELVAIHKDFAQVYMAKQQLERLFGYSLANCRQHLSSDNDLGSASVMPPRYWAKACKR